MNCEGLILLHVRSLRRRRHSQRGTRRGVIQFSPGEGEGVTFLCRSRRPKFACLGAVTKETGRGEGGGRRRKVFLVGRKTAATLASKGENRQRLLLAFWALGRSGETSSILASSLQKAHYMAVAGRVYISCYNEVGREREGETTFIAWAAAAAAALQCEEAGEKGLFFAVFIFAPPASSYQKRN